MPTSEKISLALLAFCAVMILIRLRRPQLERSPRYRAAEFLMFSGYMLPGLAVVTRLNADLRSVSLPVGAGIGLLGLLWMFYEGRKDRTAA